MLVVTIVCVVTIVLMLALVTIQALVAQTCPDCGCALVYNGHTPLSKRYRCSHCKKWWWYHQIHGR